MKRNSNKYFFIIWGIIIALYNIILFLLINQFAKGFFSKISFWVIYGSMIFAFALLLVIGIFDKKSKFGGLSPIITFVYPYVGIVFLFTTIMMFFAGKIMAIFVLLPMILLTGVLAIFAAFGAMNKEQIKNNPQRVQELFNIEDLEDYFSQLANEYNSFKNELSDLASTCEGLLTVKKNSEIENIEKRLFEYASFIKKNVANDESLNIHNNIKCFKKLLEEREALIAKL